MTLPPSCALRDPCHSAVALGDVRDETDTLAAVQSIVDACPPLVGFLVDGQPKGFSLGTTRKNLEDLQKWTNTLRASISRVHDALAGDFTDFETDQVSLYYFSDIPRLMYALNERFQTMGGVAEARAQADAQRTALTQAELDLADAQATVNRYQKQVLDLQEQQRPANEKLKGLNSNLSKLASRLKQAQDYQIVRTSGKHKLPRNMIRRWSPKGLSVYPTRKSIRRFRDRVRMLTRRSAPRKTAELIKELNPTLRGWGEYYKRAHVRRLFVALPGGFGTLEEFCKAVTWTQLGLHAKPCGVLNVLGYYTPLLAVFDHAVEERFLKTENRGLLIVE